MNEKRNFWNEIEKELMQILAIFAAGLISVLFGVGAFTLLALGKVEAIPALCLSFFVTGMLMQSLKVETRRTK